MKYEDDILARLKNLEYPSKMSKKKIYMTYEQKVALLDFIKEHHKLYFGKYSPEFTVQQSRDLWKQITTSLNSIPGGCEKTWRQWRKAWQDLKGKRKFDLKIDNKKGSRHKDSSASSDDDEFGDGEPMSQFVEAKGLEFLKYYKGSLSDALKTYLANSSSNPQYNEVTFCGRTETDHMEDQKWKEEYYKKKLILMERDVKAKERIAAALENLQFQT